MWFCSIRGTSGNLMFHSCFWGRNTQRNTLNHHTPIQLDSSLMAGVRTTTCPTCDLQTKSESAEKQLMNSTDDPFFPLSQSKSWHLNTLQILLTAFCSSNVTAAAETVKNAQRLKANLNDRNALFIHYHRNSSCFYFIPKTRWRGKDDLNKPVYWVTFS